MGKDYYKILSVESNAPQEEIKKAYRRLAHKHHPDKQGGNEARFKEINEAYYVLGEEKRRREYDRYGQVFSGQGGPSSEAGAGFDFESVWRNFNAGASGGTAGDFSDIFSDIFGFAGGRSGMPRGSDISIDIEIPFAEAVFGTTRKIRLRKTSTCETCRGTGARPGTSKTNCTICSGSGTVRQSQRSLFGTFTSLSECSKCRGAGEIAQDPCSSCRGESVLKKEEETEIQIPSGIQNSEMIRIVGAGEARAHGISGDLYVKIHVPAHPQFHREGNHIITTLEIPLSDALLGAEKVLDTIDGRVKIKIPAGMDSGETLRIKSRGIPKPPHGRGDLLIKVAVKNPKKLSPKARQLIEELRNEGI